MVWRRAGQSNKSFRVNVPQNDRRRDESAFGIGNVNKIKEVCRAYSASVRIVYEPKDNNPAHAGIRRLPRDDFALLEALATNAFVDLVHNAAIPQAT
jgi:hypothetical protein